MTLAAKPRSAVAVEPSTGAAQTTKLTWRDPVRRLPLSSGHPRTANDANASIFPLIPTGRGSFVPMHRAALRALRKTSTHLGAVRHVARSSTPRRLRFSVPPPTAHVPLRSSMYYGRLQAVLALGIVVGYGAWYSFNETSAGAARGLTSTQGSAGGDYVPSPAPTRTVLVIGDDELRQGTVVGEGPISKPTTDDGQRIVEMLTSEQATLKLRRQEKSFAVHRGEGVTRYDLVQLSSNDPIEDDHAEKIIEVPPKMGGQGGSQDWMFWGVFDGHSGWTTSATLRRNLISYVARELNSTYTAAKNGPPSPEAIDLAIKTGFNRLDHEIVHTSVEKVFKAKSKPVAATLLQPALSGSCALLSFYDSSSKTLRVACTGDSRAVLGRRSESGKWTASALSEDQTGSNPREAARMRSEHPGEEHVVRNGRVLGGLEPTRAFGDAVYKWSKEVAGKLRQSFFGRSPSPLLKTPPYVTAEPVITTTRVDPAKGDFLVLATDGLWEMLTNEEVVGLVGQWLETKAATSTAPSQFESVWSKIFGSRAKALPVEQSAAAEKRPGGQKTPVRQLQWGIDPETNDRFTVRDNNVATHLIRNALGGSNDELVRALLTLPAPFSRRYRDDLTVQVIFFGNGEKTGEVKLNLDATAEPDPPKSEL
ncbi:hypothetical protein L249_2357 [Ophiocordyceps polyrhachis-furcata BCC 54312]|uniref:PPM-type phosphatase domain-containing protein n=1 Tax=Ophiocordyceps polyrhachis-furcata BCC 54312 TaxID=1330021 RepID=A0A367LP59_9HYPO|nr:hypothetical protein L249_2357 [Ophiocordyceps polyrhachis-furcata BCC 54312]